MDSPAFGNVQRMLLSKQHAKVTASPSLFVSGPSGGKHLQEVRWLPQKAQPAGLHRCRGLLLEVSDSHNDLLATAADG